MVAFISSPIDTLLQPATRARAPSRTCTVVPTLPLKSNLRCDLRETNLPTDTRWGSRSRDPIGLKGGENFYSYVNAAPLVAIDPSGKVTISCRCQKYIPRDQGGGLREYWVTTNCTELATNCCRRACGDGWFDGNFKVVPGDDAYDEAEQDFKQHVCEIVVCCIPFPGGVAAGTASRLCFRGKIIFTNRGHAIVQIISPSGKVFLRHMPGKSFVGKPMTCRGAEYYLKSVPWWGRLFPDLPLRHPLGPSSTICSPNCVWTAIRGIGNAL